MSSSKHWEYSSSLMGQIPVSLAWRCWSLLSNFYWRSRTSCFVAGVAATDWILNAGNITIVVAFNQYALLEEEWSLRCLRYKCLQDFEDLLYPGLWWEYFILLLASSWDQDRIWIFDETRGLSEVGLWLGYHSWNFYF